MGIFDKISRKKKKEEEARLEIERQERLKKEQEGKDLSERKKQEELERERKEAWKKIVSDVLQNGNTVKSASSFEEDNQTSFFQFGDICLRKMGSELCVAPYDTKASDADVLHLIADTPEIKKHLPGLNFSDTEQSKKALQGYMFQTETQIDITYVIRQGNFPIGMIYVHTPKYNIHVVGLKIWTIDFFIASIFDHKGIMKHSLIRVKEQMKSAMGVSKAYALTEPDYN